MAEHVMAKGMTCFNIFSCTVTVCCGKEISIEITRHNNLAFNGQVFYFVRPTTNMPLFVLYVFRDLIVIWLLRRLTIELPVDIWWSIYTTSTSGQAKANHWHRSSVFFRAPYAQTIKDAQRMILYSVNMWSNNCDVIRIL